MVERVASILRHDYREIIGSPLILEFLDIYSKLYLNGGQPNHCEACHRKYWQELNQTGIQMAEKLEAIKTRTLIPAWNGLMWVPSAARHFDSARITDQEACSCLIDGQLRESHFEKLPDDYVSYKSELEKEATPDPVPVKKPATKKVKKNEAGTEGHK